MKVHPKEGVVIIKVVIKEEDFMELFIIVVKKRIDPLNVRILIRRSIVKKMLWYMKIHQMNLRRKET